MSTRIIEIPITSLSELESFTTIQARYIEPLSKDIDWLPALVNIVSPKDKTGNYIPIENIVLENIVFDLNKSSHYGLRLVGCRNITIRNCVFKGYAFNQNQVFENMATESTLYISDCQNIMIEACHFVNNDSGKPLEVNDYQPRQLNRCITLEGYTTANVTIQNNHFGPSPSGTPKPAIISQEEWAVDQQQPIVQGITCVGYALIESDFIIKGNTFKNAIDNALYLTACHGATIQDNTFQEIEEAIVLYGSANTIDEALATGSFTISKNRFYNISNTILGISGNIQNGKNFRYTKKIDFCANIINQKYQRDSSLPGEKGTPIFFRSAQNQLGEPESYKVLTLNVQANAFTSLHRDFHVFHFGNIGVLHFDDNQLDGDINTANQRAFFFCRMNQPLSPGSTIRNNRIRKKKDPYTHQPMLPFAFENTILAYTPGLTPADILQHVRPTETFATYYPLHEGDTTFQWNEWDSVKWRSVYQGATSLTSHQVHAERYEATSPTPLQAGQTIRYFSTYTPVSSVPPFYTEDYVCQVYAKGLVAQDFTLGQDWLQGTWLRAEPFTTIRLVIDGKPLQEVKATPAPDGTYDFRYYMKNQLTSENEDVRLQALGKKNSNSDTPLILDEIRIPILQKGLLTSHSYHQEDTTLLVHVTENRQQVYSLHSLVNEKVVASVVLSNESSFYYPVPPKLTHQDSWVIEAHNIYGDVVAKWTPPASTGEVWTDIPSYTLDTKSILSIGYDDGKVHSVQITVNQVLVAVVNSLPHATTKAVLSLDLRKHVQSITDQVQIIALDEQLQPLDSADIPIIYNGLVLETAHQQANPSQLIIQGRLDLTLIPEAAFQRPTTLEQWANCFESAILSHTLSVRVIKMEQQPSNTNEIYLFTLSTEDSKASIPIATQLHMQLQHALGFPMMHAETTVYIPVLKTIQPFTIQQNSFITGAFDATCRAQLTGKIALQLRVDGILQGSPAYWDAAQLDWQHYAKSWITFSKQHVELLVYHGNTVIDCRTVPLYTYAIKSASTIQLGKTQQLIITLAKSAESLTGLTLYRNNQFHSGVGGVLNSALEEKSLTFYVNATDFTLSDVLSLRAYISGRLVHEIPLPVEVPIFQSAVYSLGTTEVTGTYQQHAKSEWQLKLLALQIDDVPVLSKVPPLTSTTFKYYAKGKIDATSNVYVCGYNMVGELLQRFPVTLI